MAENIVLEKQIVEKSKIMPCKINDVNLRKRAFVLNLGANIVADFLNKSGVRTDTKLSLYRVAAFARNLEMADVYVDGKRLDVRVTFDGEVFTVPKIQEKYDAQPCAYVVLQLDKSLQNASVLGFVSAEDLPKVKSETEYFEYGVSILQPISELGDFLSQVELEQKIYSSVDHEKIKELVLAFIDDEISESEKVYFIKHVVSCPVCREVFCDTNDFDMVVCDVKNYPELLSDSTLSVLSGNKQEVDEVVLANMAVVENAIEASDDEVSIDFLDGIIKENPESENVETVTEDIVVTDDEQFDTVMEDDDLIFPEAPVPAAPVEFFDEISLDFDDTKTVEENADDDNIIVAEDVIEKNTVENFVQDVVDEQNEIVKEDEDLVLPMGVPKDFDFGTDADETIDVLGEEEDIVEESQNPEVFELVDEEPKEDFIQQDEIIETVEEMDLLDNDEISEEKALEEAEDDNLLMDEHNIANDLVSHDELSEDVVLEHDEEHDILSHDDEFDILTHDDEHDFILEEHVEEPAPVKIEETQVEKKAYDFRLETEVDDEPVEEELLIKNVSEPTDNEIKPDEKLEEIIYPMSAQKPVELVYDEDDDAEEDNDTEEDDNGSILNEQENELFAQSDEEQTAIENSSEFEIASEPNEQVGQEFKEEVTTEEVSLQFDSQESNNHSDSEKTSLDSKEDEIQQLLDDDLLALLTDDNSEQIVVPNSQENNLQDKTQVTENVQEDTSIEENSIETLYEQSQTQENSEQKEFELAQEPVSAKTVSATKRLLVLLAMLLLIAGGGAGMWFFNNAKNQADNYNDGLNQDAEIFDMQNKTNESEAPAISQDINKSMTNSFSDKPAAITITKLSWQISEKLATDDSVKEYLQTAGKNIQMNLQNDLANSADVNFNNVVKVSFEISQENALKGIQVLESSGSDQLDDIIVRGIKNTLKYVSVPKVKDYDSDYFLTLIINF